jgi:hypothetical protein
MKCFARLKYASGRVSKKIPVVVILSKCGRKAYGGAVNFKLKKAKTVKAFELLISTTVLFSQPTFLYGTDFQLNNIELTID